MDEAGNEISGLHPCADPQCRNLAPPDQLYCEHHLRGLEAPIVAPPPTSEPQVWARSALVAGSAMLLFWCLIWLAPRSGTGPASTSLPSPADLVQWTQRPSPTLPLAVLSGVTGFLAALFALRCAGSRRERVRSRVLAILGVPHLFAAAVLAVMAMRGMGR